MPAHRFQRKAGQGLDKRAIFHAASWSAFSWVAQGEAFSLSGAIPILKLIGSEPILLDPPC